MANRLVVGILTKDFKGVVRTRGDTLHSNLLGILQIFSCFLVGYDDPPFHGMLIPSAVCESVRGDVGFEFFDNRTGGRIGFLGSQGGFG
jgi:hypothetical protein